MRKRAGSGAGVVGLMLLGLALVGCGSSISAGTVTEKSYSPEYQYMTQQCAGYNKDGACTVWMPIWHTMPESFTLDLRDGEKDGYVRVSEAEYESYEVGDYYPRGSR